jgi:putative dimethyl sulfoxide reductase chaperone
MPTPFEELRSVKDEERKADWAARSDAPRRSVFGNYGPESRSGPEEEALPASNLEVQTSNFKTSRLASAAASEPGLQAAIDTAIARMFLHQFLARAFEDPTMERWEWLTASNIHAALQSAARVLTADSLRLDKTATALASRLQRDRFEAFQAACVTAFGHAARGDCPLNEIEYGDLKADPLFQPHRLADLAAFYRAFGLDVADSAAERPDHLGIELEFMSVLAAKEAYALEYQLDADHRAVCHDAQKKFLREHLGRWAPAFARRLVRAATDETLAVLAEFLRDFIAADCARFDVPAGSEDLLLRPVDEAAESLCAACGLQNLPPGANATGTTT